MSSSIADASGLTPQERHDIIINYLKEINKPTKVFHLRWRPGDKLNGKILRQTPMFWYMKYGWSRIQIENMFFKARIEIDPLFDSALQQVFGGSAGPRWRGGGGVVPTRKKWKTRHQDNNAVWTGQSANNISNNNNSNTNSNSNTSSGSDNTNLKHTLDQNLNHKKNDIWNAVSDFGADKAIDYKTFSDNLKDRGINVSPLLAQQLFDQLAGPSGKITKQQMDELIKQLDNMVFDSTITWDDMSSKLGAQMVMKRVLLAAGSGEPFNVDDFVFASKFGVNISPIQFMGKLTDRDIPWDDRLRSMETLSANIGSNPTFNNVLAKPNIPELLCGWATQLLDQKPEVQKTAIDLLPNVWKQCLQKGDPQTTIGHLEEILDNLFKILDDPKCFKNHPAAKDAVSKIVDDIIDMKDPESVLYLAGLLGEKCELENVTSAPARAFALEQLQKIMFGSDSPLIGNSDLQTAPIMSAQNLPNRGTVNREWLDIATKNQPGPSSAMYNDPLEEEYLNEQFGQKGKKYRPQKSGVTDKNAPLQGIGDDEFFQGGPFDPAAPYAHVTSNPTNAKINQDVSFDASKSKDCDNEPVKEYEWNFGDNTPLVTTYTPYTKHKYGKPQVYPVTVKVTCKYNKNAKAGLNQRVQDPKNPLPPYVQLNSNPPTSKTKQPVTFDASKSHDTNGNPCVNYVFDFGDGSPKVHTPKHTVKHPYEKEGTYPVTVIATDKNGLQGTAALTQRVMDPTKQDPTLPYAAVSSTPNDPKPKDLVAFDASKSVDCDGDPCKNYVWDFGDFTPQVKTTKPVVKHAFDKPGTYPVTCTVEDKYGKKAKASCRQMVEPPFNASSSIPPRLPPHAALSSNPQETVPMQPVYFDASKSHDAKGDPCIEYLWNFGDKSPTVTTKEPNTKHPYKSVGTYNVKVTVKDKQNMTATASVNQRCREPDPLAPYAAVSSTPTNANPSQPVKIDASESVDANGKPCKNYVFDFGDGTPPLKTSDPVVNHVYNEPGTYPVTCTVTDKAGKKANAHLNQRIKDPQNDIAPPYASLQSNPKDTFPYEPVNFDASKSHDMDNGPCTSFLFDFGDGTQPVQSNTPYSKHKYEKPGTYPVQVTVTDKNGLTADASVSQRVSNDPAFNASNNEPDLPYAAVNSLPTNANPSQPVKIDATESVDKDGDPCKNFVFDFGDGKPPVTSTNPVVNHAYNEPGTYPVKCTVTDKYGKKATATLTQRVKSPYNDIGPPYAHLTSDPKQSYPYQPVIFDASKSHDAQNKPCKSYVFDFGDNTPKEKSMSPKVKHPYKQPGTYPVTVTVVDNRDKTSKASVNQRVSPDPSFGSNRNDPAAMPVFNASSNDPNAPTAVVNSTPTNANPSQPVRLDASDSKDIDGDPCKNFLWDFGDGTPKVTTTTPVANHAYNKPGAYPVKCTVTDKYGKTGTASLGQRVKNPFRDVGPPYAHLAANPIQTNPYEQVEFDASKSHDAKDKPCKSFLFDFGDGTPKQQSNTPKVKHPYKQPGTYPVNVTVTDNNGKTADASVQQRVSPDPSFNANSNDPNMPPFTSSNNIPNEYKNDPDMPTFNRMDPEELGDEFRGVTSDAVSKMIMDPNRKNQRKGKRMADVLTQLNPNWPKDLDPEAQKRLKKWSFPKKPFKPKLPPKKFLPALKPGKPVVNAIDMSRKFNFNTTNLPDI